MRELVGHVSQITDAQWVKAISDLLGSSSLRVLDSTNLPDFGSIQFSDSKKLLGVTEEGAAAQEVQSKFSKDSCDLVITTLETLYGRAIASKAAKEGIPCMIIQPGYSVGFLLGNGGLRFLNGLGTPEYRKKKIAIAAPMDCLELSAIKGSFPVFITGHPLLQFPLVPKGLTQEELFKQIGLDSKKSAHCYIGTSVQQGSEAERLYLETLTAWLTYVKNSDAQGVICLHPKSDGARERKAIQGLSLGQFVVVCKETKPLEGVKQATTADVAFFCGGSVLAWDSSMLMSHAPHLKERNTRYAYFNLDSTFKNMGTERGAVLHLKTRDELTLFMQGTLQTRVSQSTQACNFDDLLRWANLTNPPMSVSNRYKLFVATTTPERCCCSYCSPADAQFKI